MKLPLSSLPGYLFYLFIFFLPWQTRWIIRDPSLGGWVWEYSRISLYSWDIVLALLVLVSLPLLWQEIKNQKSKIKIFSDPFSIYLLLLLFTLTSILWSPDKLLALVWSLRLLEGGLVWLLVKALKPKLESVLLSLAAAGTVQALWSIWQFVRQATFANKWLGVAIHLISQGGTSVVLTQAGLWLRAYAGQVHPNVLGGLLTITSLATAWLYFYSKSQISNLNGQISPKSQIGKSISSYSLLLLYTIQLIGLFFSFSRGAWLALFITLGLWFYRDRPKSVRSRTLAIKTTYGLRNAALAAPDTFRLGMFEFSKGAINILLATVMVFVLLGLWLWQPTVGRFFGGSRLEQQSVEERMGSVGESQSLLKGSWWRGLGYGNYTVALQASQPGLNSWRYQPVHNVFLLILTELGVVGLGLFLWLLWVILSPLTTHFSPPVPVASGYWLVAIIVTALFDHYWWTIPSMMLLFWLVVAIAWLEDSPVSGGS